MITAFDTENKQDGTFIHGVLTDGRNIDVFRNSKSLRNRLKEIGDVSYANNLFYDFGNLYSKKDFSDDILEINSGRTVIRQGRFIALKYRGYPTMFYDLFNYLRMSIETAGAAMGFPKLEYDPFNLDYCVRDVEITHRAAIKCVELVQEEFDINPKPTTASYAMAIYKKLKFPPIPKLRGMDYFKQGYFGGRTEAFFIGTKRMAVYDINSAYPYAMTQPIPFGKPKQVHTFDIRPTDFVDCIVDIPDSQYGLLPIKYGWSSLCFPVGRIRGQFWGVELLAAIKHGAKLFDVKSVVRYDDVGCYFKDFANMLYDLRLIYAGDAILKMFIKLILNSFYGKLATKFIVQKIVTEKNMREVYNDDYIFKKGSYLGLAERDYGFVKQARVDIAGFITATVRALLLDAITETGAYYCDTDSIFVSPSCAPRNVAGSLGAFKKEYTGTITIVGAKMYYSADYKKIACKGVPKTFQKEALRTVGGQILMKRPRLWLTAMKQNKQPNEWTEFKKTIVAGSQNRAGVFGYTDPFVMKRGHLCGEY